MPDPRILLLTRPQRQADEFAAALDAALPGRFRAVIAPVLRIAPVPAAIDLAGAQGLIFTSANGVEIFAALSPERGLPAWCVGEMTAEAARAAGFAARAADGEVAGLAARVASEARREAGAVLHIRGRHAAGDLLGRLAAAGVPARAVEIYDQAPCALSPEARALLAAGAVDVLACFSPRSAALFAAQARDAGWDLARTALVSLSAAADAAHAAPAPGRRVVAAAPTRAAMLDALKAL